LSTVPGDEAKERLRDRERGRELAWHAMVVLLEVEEEGTRENGEDQDENDDDSDDPVK
jgi:hypothetical protein